MNIITNTNGVFDSIPPILNQNRIKEKSEKEAIVTMGMSICQIGCTGGGQSYRYYRSRH